MDKGPVEPLLGCKRFFIGLVTNEPKPPGSLLRDLEVGRRLDPLKDSISAMATAALLVISDLRRLMSPSSRHILAKIDGGEGRFVQLDPIK